MMPSTIRSARASTAPPGRPSALWLALTSTPTPLALRDASMPAMMLRWKLLSSTGSRTPTVRDRWVRSERASVLTR